MSAPGEQQIVRPRRDWNALSALIAALIGLLALLVSGYTAWLQNRQARAQVWPHLTIYRTPAEQGYQLMNKGVGPARLVEVRVVRDGTAYTDWSSLLADMKIDAATSSYTTMSGMVLQAGEKLRMLHLSDQAAFSAFDAERESVKIFICYCSVLDECWVLGQDDANLPIDGSQCPSFDPPRFRN